MTDHANKDSVTSLQGYKMSSQQYQELYAKKIQKFIIDEPLSDIFSPTIRSAKSDAIKAPKMSKIVTSPKQ